MIRLSQFFLINMAFAAYVLENAMLLFSPGVAFARFFKAPPWGFCMNRPVKGARGGGGGGAKISAAFNYQRKMTIITPGEDYHLSLPRGLLGLLHH